MVTFLGPRVETTKHTKYLRNSIASTSVAPVVPHADAVRDPRAVMIEAEHLAKLSEGPPEAPHAVVAEGAMLGSRRPIGTLRNGLAL